MQPLVIKRPAHLSPNAEKSVFPVPADKDFDSVTDHHTMHIVYKNEKVYPSYLIEFK
jgi:hypothetical protein